MSDWKAVQSLLLGALTIDVDEWRSAVMCQFYGGPDTDPRFRASEARFWRAVAQLNATDRRRLLFFWTAESPPTAGLNHLDRRMTLRFDCTPMVVQPRAATCFYALTMPVLADDASAMRHVQQAVAHWNAWGHE